MVLVGAYTFVISYGVVLMSLSTCSPLAFYFYTKPSNYDSQDTLSRHSYQNHSANTMRFSTAVVLSVLAVSSAVSAAPLVARGDGLVDGLVARGPG